MFTFRIPTYIFTYVYLPKRLVFHHWVFTWVSLSCFTGLLLWPGWPGVAQLCQVFPQSVSRGAWTCREANESAEPEGGENFPTRCQGKSTPSFKAILFKFVHINFVHWIRFHVLGYRLARVTRAAYEPKDTEGVRVLSCLSLLTLKHNPFNDLVKR